MTEHRLPKGPPPTVLDRIMQIICLVSLAVTLLASGFGACTLPSTTTALSQAYSQSALSPYPADLLTQLAGATRNYTVDPPSDNSIERARGLLCEEILDAALIASAEDSPKRDSWTLGARTLLTEWQNQASEPDTAPATLNSATAVESALARLSDAYALDSDALSHLEDCNRLITSVIPWLWAFVIAALVCGIGLFGRRQRMLAGYALIGAPLGVIACFAVFAIWAAVDWFGFFSAFHGVFFPQGNWQFSDYSLLICMYPEPFWTGMAMVWLSVTLVLSILSLGVGILLVYRARKRQGR